MHCVPCGDGDQEMKIITQGFPSDQDVDWGGHAILDLHTVDLREVVRYEKQMVKQMARYPAFDALVFYNNCVTFYDGEPNGLLKPDQLAVYENIGYVVLPDNYNPQQHDETRTESPRLYIQQFGLTWRTCVRHGDCEVATNQLPWDLFRCTNHGTSRKAAATCLVCIAKT